MKNYFLLFVFVFITTLVLGQRTLIHCGSLIDGKNKELQQQVTLVVEANKITSVDKGFTKPDKNDKLIDLSKKTVMPGLIDMHVHLEGETSKDGLVKRFTQNEADVAFQSTVYAKKTLMAGFTTVRDCGGSGVNISLRNAINAGIVIGPRVFTAGKAIASTGGHGDPTNGYRKDLMGDPGAKEGVINSPEDARKAVRQRYKDGADFIKITATGGVLSVAKDGSGPQFTQEEVNAIVETAKDYGMITAAHAHGAEGMKRAVLAGITTIEHGTLMTEEVMDLMKQKGTYHVPTIIAGRSAAEYAKIPGYYHPLVVPKAIAIGSKIQENFGKAYKRGVKMAFGTDAGVFPHGDNAKEFGYMVEGGMPAIEALLCAMQVNATILGWGDKIGSLEKGKLADIIAVDEDPTKNIATMLKVSFVMKDGVVYKE
ncbi:MAG: Xaa-Pro dipeptidase family enzyme [Cytophagales bacterium]|jgi:imidazolonepropionase-like amidohydrolase|nr:amidohydrolase family protein [Bacteroidota bacterium]MBS1980652.1 amidohydrolase family protein [Bacteroidota bacterium]WHZ07978.1 MAG: Xaa-Pro dipeptidase family enzyme [Cytophagales bacterium]